MPHLIRYISGSVTRDSLVGAGRKCLSTSTFTLPTDRKFSSGHVNNQWQALTWITQHPDRVNPADILPSFAHFRTSSQQSPVVPILFASPQFAAWTEPTGSLLSQWVTPLLNQIHAGDAPNVVYTVAAVVDRISDNSDARNVSPATEGLSLLLADSSSVTASVATPTRLKSNASEEPAFFLETRSFDESSQLLHEVGLRLARTVFRNGRDRTLLGMRWTRDESAKNYILDSYHDLSSCTVTSPVREAHCSVNVPFHPVTQRRRVISSMGNILRQVSKTIDDDTSAGIPASSELEKELPRYVNERGIPHGRVAVWALVEPSTVSSLSDTSQRDVEDLLSKGSKIHRVVSGGGGWGKKQGLLSLDPEVAFGEGNRLSREASLDQTFALSPESEPFLATDLPDFFEGFGLEENMASLSQVAPPGDYIQFFVASESGAFIQSKDESTPPALTYSFGVDAPDESTETSSRNSDGIVIVPNHFGAVSESAISYSRKDLSELPAHALKCETKISVPGSRIDLSVS